MTNEEWKTWSDYHLTLFRWIDEKDGKMLSLWRPSFESRGFTLVELKEASLVLAQSPKAGLWRAEHFEFLLRHVSGSRAAQAQAREAQERSAESKPKCDLCRDTGLVPVPDLRPAATKYATAAVVCSCNRGIWQQNKHSEEQERRRDKNKKPLPKWITLEEYEKRVPGWQEIMVQWEHGRELDRTAREESAYADRKRGPLKIGEAVKQVIDKAVK
jgi:hypothetical protein